VAGSYTVTFDGTVPSTSFHVHRSGVVTLVCSTSHSTSNTVRVGDVAGDVGTMRVTTGTFTAGSTITVGNASGSTGTLHVDDDDADLLQGGTAADVIVGSFGSGTLNVTGGGFVDAADDVILGNSSGQGTLLVSGVNASPLVRSTLSSSGSDGDLVFGNGGAGTVTIAAGGQAFAADDVRIALGPSSQGSVTVRGTSGAAAISSSLSVGGDLEIASNPGSATANGVGELTVQDTAFVSVTGVTRVGDPDGGTGTLRMRPAGSLTTGSLQVDDAHGVLDFQGGTIIVDGGLFDPPGTTLVLDHPRFEGVVLQDGATTSFDGGSSAGYSLILGEATNGSMRLTGGPHLTHVNGVLSMGLLPGGFGRLELFDAALLDGAGTVVVGQGGAGELRLSGGSDLSLSDMLVAYSPGSDGLVNLSGAGTTLTLGSMTIGGQAGTPGGVADVIVGNGAVLQTNGSAVNTARSLHPDATLEIQSGGAVTVRNNFDHRGHLRMSGGQLTVGNLNVSSFGSLVGHGTVAGNTFLGGNDCLIHAVGGNLTIGNPSSTFGFSNAGTMVIDTSTVTLQDSNGSTLGDVVLHNGILNLGLAINSVQSGKTMSGVGGVNGSLSIAGTLSPGASAGTITVHGPFQQVGSGRMTMEIGDAATSQFDRVVATAGVTLAGTLDVRMLPGFVPDPGEEFTLISGAARTGTFSTVTLEGQPVNGQFTLVYTATSVVLRVNQITVDVPEPDGRPRELAFMGRSGDRSGAGFELVLPEASRVSVRLYSATGRFVGTLLEGDREAGVVRLPLGALGKDLSSGVYFGRVRGRTEGAEWTRSAKVTLIK
jgi:fibronectin-binding autotransporter adhesin